MLLGGQTAAAAATRPGEGPRERALLMDKTISRVGPLEISCWEETEDEFVVAWREEAGENVSAIFLKYTEYSTIKVADIWLFRLGRSTMISPGRPSTQQKCHQGHR